MDLYIVFIYIYEAVIKPPLAYYKYINVTYILEMDNHLILKLLCGYLSVRDIMCFSVLSKAMYGEEEEFYKYFFNAKKSMINEYWLDLFLNNVEINKYHIYDILNNFQNCILNLSLIHI